MAGEQYVILAQTESEGGPMKPLGTRQEIVEKVSDYNTAPDHEGGDALYGPGFILELPPQDPVTQMLLTVSEEEIAWLVIMRLTRRFQWKLLDMVSGRELIPS